MQTQSVSFPRRSFLSSFIPVSSLFPPSLPLASSPFSPLPFLPPLRRSHWPARTQSQKWRNKTERRGRAGGSSPGPALALATSDGDRDGGQPGRQTEIRAAPVVGQRPAAAAAAAARGCQQSVPVQQLVRSCPPSRV